MFQHRVRNPLKNGLDKGKRFFFLYGNGIKDCFLESFYHGIVSLEQTLKNYFLKELEYYVFIRVTTESVEAFQLTDPDHMQISLMEDFFTITQPKDDLDDIDESEKPKTDEARNLESNLNQSGIQIKNRLNILKEKIEQSVSSKNNKKEMYAVFFEDFDWITGLYGSQPAVEYIKLLKEFSLLENTVTVASLEDVDLMKKYNFETKGSNVLFLGNPSAPEIKYAFLRTFLKETVFDRTPIQANLFLELDEISQAMASSKKSLRDSLNVLDTVVISRKNKTINKENFEIAIEKIISEKIMLEDVILDQETKNIIERAVDTFLKEESNMEFRKGLILTGPPGTGKTQMVRALANEKNCYFMAPTLSDLKGEYVGHSSAKVKRLFDEARANTPAIIFIDEADTVFPDRNLGAGNSDSFNLDMVNQFLQEIDGMKSGKEKIFTIAATNRPSIIDSAIQSRLSQRIEIGLPDGPTRIRIFDSKLKKYGFKLSDKSYRNEIEKKSEKMSGRDIDNFVKKLKEKVMGTSFHEIKNLGNNRESKELFLQILEDNEKVLIEDLQHMISVEILRPEEIGRGFDSIIGYDDVKEKITRQAEFIKSTPKHVKIRNQYGIQSNRGILLYGPPGNAKTEMVKAAAKEHQFYFVKVLSKDFVSDFTEKQISNLQTIFSQVLRLSKISNYQGVILFFDEFDSLAAKGILGQAVRGTLLDDLGSTSGLRADDSRILFMAATNMKDQLDEAVIRKGRIDEHLFMDNPTVEHGTEILRRKFKCDQKVDIDECMFGVLYHKLKKKKERQEAQKLIYISQLLKEEEKTQDQIREQIERTVRPSGSELVNLYNEIKTEAFYRNKNDLDGRQPIQITDDIIKAYFDDDLDGR